MGKTLTEKILETCLIEGKLKAGERIAIKANQSLSHDLNVIMTYLALESAGVERAKIDLAVQYMDHNMIQADFKNDDDHRYIMDMAAKLGIIVARPGSGICHQLHLERFAKPGQVLIGGDSHTVAAGGIGMFSIGVGGFDNAMALAGKPFYFTMPKVVKVTLTGELPDFVSAKNIVLELLRRVGVKGGKGKIYEYCGPGVEKLSVTERSTITNMGQETGATTSIFPSDEQTYRWLKAYSREEDYCALSADEDAQYDEEMEICLSDLEPLIALPHLPENVVPVRQVQGKTIHQVMVGSCTNTALMDVLSVAHILEGQQVHPDVDFGLYPSTQTVVQEAVARGAYEKLLCAGVRIFEPICGGCNGSGFAPMTNGVSLRTTPRNFLGRTGTKTAQVYLCAPETAAASAIRGVITDPRDLGIEPFKGSMPEEFVDCKNWFIYPKERGEKITIRRGPNIQPIPPMHPMDSQVLGEVLLRLGDDISTDHICPAGANFLPIRSNIPEMAKYAFRVVDEQFAQRAKKKGGGFLVVGENYGQGSSREQAAVLPRYLGIKAIIAKSYARLHHANLVNWGILPLIFVQNEDYDRIEAEDVLSLDREDILPSQVFYVINKTKDLCIPVKTELSASEIESIKLGGRINQLRED